jgi:hypothetical protein
MYGGSHARVPGWYRSRIPAQQSHAVPGLNGPAGGGTANDAPPSPAGGVYGKPGGDWTRAAPPPQQQQGAQQQAPSYGRRSASREQVRRSVASGPASAAAAGRDQELAGRAARAAVGGGGAYERGTFPSSYHPSSQQSRGLQVAAARRDGPPDIAADLERAKMDPSIPAVGEQLRAAELQLERQQREMDRLAIENADQSRSHIGPGLAGGPGGASTEAAHRSGSSPSAQAAAGGLWMNPVEPPRVAGNGRRNLMRPVEATAGSCLNHGAAGISGSYNPSWDGGGGSTSSSTSRVSNYKPKTMSAEEASQYPGWHNSSSAYSPKPAPRLSMGGEGGGGGHMASGVGSSRSAAATMTASPGVQRVLGGDWHGGPSRGAIASHLIEISPGVVQPMPGHTGFTATGASHNPGAARAMREAAEGAASNRRKNTMGHRLFY